MSSSTDWSGTNYLEGNNSLDPSTDPISVVCWGYKDTGSDGIIIQQQDGDTTGRAWLFSSGQEKVASYIGGTQTNGATNHGFDVWNHFAMTFPGGTGTVNLFLNGSNDGSASRTATATTGDIRLAANKSASQLWEGSLAYLQVFNRELSIDEINELMHAPYSIMAGCLWAPDLLDPSASTFTDISGNNNTGSLTGTPSSSALGPPVFLH